MEENNTVISPSKPWRVVNRAIEILEKALQGCHGKVATVLRRPLTVNKKDLHEPFEETGEEPLSWADEEKWRQSTPNQSTSAGNGNRKDELFKGTSPILAETPSAEEVAEAKNQESEELEGQGENNPTDGYATRKGRITQKNRFLSSRKQAVNKQNK